MSAARTAPRSRRANNEQRYSGYHALGGAAGSALPIPRNCYDDGYTHGRETRARARAGSVANPRRAAVRTEKPPAVAYKSTIHNTRRRARIVDGGGGDGRARKIEILVPANAVASSFPGAR